MYAEGGVRGTFKNGDLFESSFKTKAGTEIGILAETTISGKTLTLSDASIYSNVGDIKNQVGVKDFLQLKKQLAEIAKDEGITTLIIKGERVMNSTSANPGHVIDFTIDLTKLK